MGYFRWLGFLMSCLAVNGYDLRTCKLSQNKQNYTCGLPGYVGSADPQTGNSFAVQDLEECRELSFATYLENPTYYFYSFSFDTSFLFCTLYQSNFQSFTENKQSTTYFYDYQCYRCNTTCPVPANTNLLLNSGFELPSNISIPWNHTPTAGGYKSQHAISSPFQIKQYVYFCPNYVYRVGFWYKIDGVKATAAGQGGKFQVDYGFYYIKNRFEVNDLYVTSTQGSWVRLEDYFYVQQQKFDTFDPPLLELRTYDSSAPKGATLLIDNVELYAIEPAEAVRTMAGASNLFKNGGFESGKETPWTISVPYFKEHVHAKLICPGINSSYALQIQNTLTHKSFQANVYISQTVPTTPYTSYVLSFDVNVHLKPGEKTGKSSMNIFLYSTSNGSKRSTSFSYFSFFKNGGANSAKIPIISDGNSMRVEMDVLPGEGETLIFDNFALIEGVLGTG